MLHFKIVSFPIFFKKKNIISLYGVLFGTRTSVTRNGFCCGIKKYSVNDCWQFKRPPLLSQGRLYELLTTTKIVKRNIMLERDVPVEHGNAVAWRYAF